MFELRKSSFPEELFEELNDEIEAASNHIYREAVGKCLNLVEASGADEKRKIHEEKLEEIRIIYTSMCVFEDGANSLKGSFFYKIKFIHLVQIH